MDSLLELRNIKKSFGTCQALKDFSFQIKKGEIIGLVGENGAGKSTAMNIVYGLYGPDRGKIIFKGREQVFSSPLVARAAGIGMVHQHFMLSPHHTVLENVLLSMEGPAFQWLSKSHWRVDLDRKVTELGFSKMAWDQTVESLSVGAQQQIEIFKALMHRPDLLILDEPTAVLTPLEVQNLFDNLLRLKKAGTAIIIISHKLREILSVTDRIYVVRHGENITEQLTKDTNLPTLASAMIGQNFIEKQNLPSRKTDDLILEFKHFETTDPGNLVQHLKIPALKIFAGEVLGIAGVEGNGQDLLIRSLMEPQSLALKSGDILFLKKSILNLSTKEILSRGLRSLPEDRLRFGVLPDRTGLENFILGGESAFGNGVWLNNDQAKIAAKESFKQFDVRPLDTQHIFKNFSGGNQQKIVVARELFHRPKFVLAAHPTRGVDLKAAQFIRDQLVKVTETKGSVLLISSDLDELFEISDRVIVIYKGELYGEFSRHEFNQHDKLKALGAAMAGARQ